MHGRDNELGIWGGIMSYRNMGREYYELGIWGGIINQEHG